MDRRPEIEPDQAAEKGAALSVLSREEKRRRKDALRKKLERQQKNKKSARRVAAKVPASGGAAGAESPTPSTPAAAVETAPLAAAAQAGAPTTPAPEAPPLCASAEQLSELLAKGDTYVAGFAAQMFGERAPRLAKVLSSLQWADDKGKPSTTAIIAAHSMWPCIEKYGWHKLPELPPEVLFIFGCAMLLGPVCIKGIDEVRAAKKERLEQSHRPPAPVVPISEARA